MSVYAERDPISQGVFYTRHIHAMTEENLHSKSAIAMELAHRDICIQALSKKCAELEEENRAGNEALKLSWQVFEKAMKENQRLTRALQKISDTADGDENIT